MPPLMKRKAEMRIKYSSSAMREPPSSRSASVCGACTLRYASAKEGRAYFLTSSGGIAVTTGTFFSASATASRTALCVSVPRSEYTGTMPLRR